MFETKEKKTISETRQEARQAIKYWKFSDVIFSFFRDETLNSRQSEINRKKLR